MTTFSPYSTTLPRLARTAALTVCACGFFSAPLASAQHVHSEWDRGTAQVTRPVTDFEAVRREKVYRPARTFDPIVIDGHIDEEAWTTAEIGSGFYQTDPQNGYPATEETLFRILYDDDNVYIAVTAFQTDLILVSDLNRDFSATDGDLIVLFFDTFHDQRNGFAFSTNPGSAMRDSKLQEASQTRTGTEFFT